MSIANPREPLIITVIIMDRGMTIAAFSISSAVRCQCLSAKSLHNAAHVGYHLSYINQLTHMSSPVDSYNDLATNLMIWRMRTVLTNERKHSSHGPHKEWKPLARPITLIEESGKNLICCNVLGSKIDKRDQDSEKPADVDSKDDCFNLRKQTT